MPTYGAPTGAVPHININVEVKYDVFGDPDFITHVSAPGELRGGVYTNTVITTTFTDPKGTTDPSRFELGFILLERIYGADNRYRELDSAYLWGDRTVTLAELLGYDLDEADVFFEDKYLGFSNLGVSDEIPIYPAATRMLPPTAVALDANNVASGAKVKLSWKGASAGTRNYITGYEIHRAEQPDGPYTLLHTKSSTSAQSSYTVTAPTKDGASYYYKIVTVGSELYLNSDYSDYVQLTCNFNTVAAPTVVTLSSTNAAPNAEVELSWSNASWEVNNPIKGYQVYRATEADGTYEPLGNPVLTTETFGSTVVTAPNKDSESYYYKVATLGTMDGFDSGLSNMYAKLTCTYSMPSAPTSVTVNGASSVYVLPDSKVVLKWSGAAQGANNPITGYAIYRDGEVLKSGLGASVDSYEVTANTEAGTSCSFTVVTLGMYADSAPSVSRVVYSYTDPTPPTDISASDDTPSAGSRVKLFWSGAAAGGYNDIVGYRVYRSEEVNGSYALAWAEMTTETSGVCFVDTHPEEGKSYYYRVVTIGSHSSSGYSEAYLQLTSGKAGAPDEDITVIVKPVPRPKRKMVFGEYDTVYDGPWTLCEWSITEPATQTNYVEIVGRMAGPLDLSTYLTGGDPRYGSRDLEARFECSENTRLWREGLISDMTNRLHGQRVDITLPDDDSRYLTGRLRVQKDYNDPAHASVTVTAVCSPWRYNKLETEVSVLAVEDVQEFVLPNTGRRILVPTVKVSGHKALVYLTCGDHTWTLTNGEYRLPELVLRSGNTTLSCYGEGIVTFTYREAVL